MRSKVNDAVIPAHSGPATEFDFVAVRQDGAQESGRLRAGSATDARAMLSSNGLYPVSLRENRRSVFRISSAGAKSNVSASDAAAGLRLLSNLVAAGLPVSKALNAFTRVAPKSWQESLPTITASVSAGHSLAVALERSRLRLPSVAIGIVRSGEVAGQLGPAINRAAAVLERAATTRAELLASLMYPLVLATTSIASATILVLIVLPKFAALLDDLGQELPRSTLLLLGFSHFARGAIPALIAAVLIFAVGVHQSSSTADGRRRLHALLLRIPIFGGVRFGFASSRVSSALSALLASGMSIAPALSHAAGAANDAEVTRRLLASRERVVGGSRLSDAVRAEAALSSTAIQMVKAGEESGRLAELLAHAAAIEDGLVANQVRTTVRLVEPLLILGFGGAIALIAAALLQAVYSIRPTL